MGQKLYFVLLKLKSTTVMGYFLRDDLECPLAAFSRPIGLRLALKLNNLIPTLIFLDDYLFVVGLGLVDLDFERLLKLHIAVDFVNFNGKHPTSVPNFPQVGEPYRNLLVRVYCIFNQLGSAGIHVIVPGDLDLVDPLALFPISLVY